MSVITGLQPNYSMYSANRRASSLLIKCKQHNVSLEAHKHNELLTWTLHTGAMLSTHTAAQSSQRVSTVKSRKDKNISEDQKPPVPPLRVYSNDKVRSIWTQHAQKGCRRRRRRRTPVLVLHVKASIHADQSFIKYNQSAPSWVSEEKSTFWTRRQRGVCLSQIRT